LRGHFLHLSWHVLSLRQRVRSLIAYGPSYLRIESTIEWITTAHALDVAVFADVDLVGHGEVVGIKWLNEEVCPMYVRRETGMLENEDIEKRGEVEMWSV